VLFLNPFRDSLVLQREQGLVNEAQLIANVFEAQLPGTGAVNMAAGDGIDVAETLAAIDIGPGVEVFVFDSVGALVGRGVGSPPVDDGLAGPERSTLITDFLNSVWDSVSEALSRPKPIPPEVASEGLARALFSEASQGGTKVNTGHDAATGSAIFTVATPILRENEVMGVVAVTSAAGEIDRLVRFEREQVLQMFVIAILVSVGLSLVLASTIANPLSDLAAAAELGRDRNARKMAPGRVRIPDLAARQSQHLHS